MAVFYSFHYERDVNRVQLIRNMGRVDGQETLNAQEWETLRREGNEAIASWIDSQMKYKTAVVVLIGQETASRLWVKYEIQKAWSDKRPLLGIRIHGLSSMGVTDTPGADPFTCIQGSEGYNPGIPIFDPTVLDYRGAVDSQGTYRVLHENILQWVQQGRVKW